jgi:tyrosine-protein phosphatase SIW14
MSAIRQYTAYGASLILTLLSCLSTNPAMAADHDGLETETGIPNFEFVSRDLWRGAAPTPKALDHLAEMGIKAVIDLRLSGPGVTKEKTQARRLGLAYYHLPLGYGRPSESEVEKFLSLVNDPANQPVYVHCRYGADRTGTMIGIFRAVNQGWDFRSAYKEMRMHHFKPWFGSMRRLVHAKCTGASPTI